MNYALAVCTVNYTLTEITNGKSMQEHTVLCLTFTWVCTFCVHACALSINVSGILNITPHGWALFAQH